MASGTTDRRIDKLIHLLVKNATVVVPGPKIASEIGVSRSTVWEWMQKLRALGVEIKGLPATGYQLTKLPDILAPSLIRQELGDNEIGHRIVHYFRADSTNNIALKVAADGAPHGTVVVAEEQTAGRGRVRGRTWHSEKASGIYVSVLLRPAMPPAGAAMLTLVAGLAAQEAVARQTGLAPDIRWPNDLLVGGRKFGGILTEMHAEPDRIRFVVVGIGINVNHERFPEELATIATSLRMATGREQSRIELLLQLLLELERYYNRFIAEGAGPIVERFSQVSSFARGKRVQVETAAETFTGTTDGLEPSGLLRVRRDGGRVEPVVSGSIREAS